MPAANITNGLNVADLSKFEATTASGILKLIDGEKLYDGSCIIPWCIASTMHRVYAEAYHVV